MCAIAGILGCEKVQQNLELMLAAMKHRGPDATGIYFDNHVFIGHNRLAIIDTSSAGNQPMQNQEASVVIAFNGEIYNFEELKKFLPSNTQLKSTTDTEVILELWNVLGSDLFPKLRGMFAIAIWDKEKQELYLARDHMGIKPLYYSEIDGKLVFASELKGVIASGLVSKKLSVGELSNYLRNGFVIQPATIYEDIKVLSPASYLLWKGGSLQIKNFWDITDLPVIELKTEMDAIEHVKTILTDSVREEVFSDRPLGIFLSGGLDSTVLLAAMRNCGIKSIRTFSIGFEGEALNEETAAKETALFYKTEHIHVNIDAKELLSQIDNYIRSLDQPSIDGLNTWIVSRAASKHVTVALSGLGGDELFSGYSIDRAILKRAKFSTFGKLLFATRNIWRKAPDYFSKRFETYSSWRSVASHFQSWVSVFSIEETQSLTGQKQLERNAFEKLDLTKKYSLIQRINNFHLRGFMMSRLLRDSDATSMAHSIEVRFPLIDYRLAHLAFHVPVHWKLKHLKKTSKLKDYEAQNTYEGNGVKHLLYQAFKHDLPCDFGHRPKRGFKLPIEKWMKKELLIDIEKTLNSDNLFLKKTHVAKVLSDWKKGQTNWVNVWALYVFEKWVTLNLR